MTPAGHASDRASTLIVLAKRPVAGRVKTRLTPHYTPHQAARLAAAALADTIDTVSSTAARSRILTMDSSPDVWVPAGWRHTLQVPSGLDERIASAFSAARGPALLVGMDTPQLRADQLLVFDPGRHDAALGLAEDGGYWAIGFADPAQAQQTVPGVPMSRADTGAQQLDRLRAAGLRVQVLDVLRDVDTAEDAHAVAAIAPHGLFAECLRTIDNDLALRAG